MTSVFLVDNYDSFTFNLVDEFEKRGCNVSVWRNHHSAERLLNEALKMPAPRWLVLSPGPGTPQSAGCLIELILLSAGKIPIFGVCLGHQAIAEAFAGKVIRAPRLMHGKTSPIMHDQSGIFTGIESPFTATRYHSLIVEEPLPKVLRRTAWTAEGELMGLAHMEHPTFGVQFHPESILTEHGHAMLKNFLETRA